MLGNSDDKGFLKCDITVIFSASSFLAFFYRGVKFPAGSPGSDRLGSF